MYLSGKPFRTLRTMTMIRTFKYEAFVWMSVYRRVDRIRSLPTSSIQHTLHTSFSSEGTLFSRLLWPFFLHAAQQNVVTGNNRHICEMAEPAQEDGKMNAREVRIHQAKKIRPIFCQDEGDACQDRSTPKASFFRRPHDHLA